MILLLFFFLSFPASTFPGGLTTAKQQLMIRFNFLGRILPIFFPLLKEGSCATGHGFLGKAIGRTIMLATLGLFPVLFAFLRGGVEE